MNIEKLNIEKLKADVYDAFKLNKDSKKRDNSIKNFIYTCPFDNSSFWRAINGKTKTVTPTHYYLFTAMDKTIYDYLH